VLNWIGRFYSQHKIKLFSTALIIAASYLFKRGFYDKLIPISDAMDHIKNKKFSKVLVGAFFMLCYFKNPHSGLSYCFSNKQLIKEEELAI